MIATRKELSTNEPATLAISHKVRCCLSSFYIDVFQHGVLGLSQLAELPTGPGVYVVQDGRLTLYVGRGMNLRNRWKGHHRFEQLKRDWPNCLVAYFVVCEERLYSAEDHLIEEMGPRLNRVTIPRPPRNERLADNNPKIAELYATLDLLDAIKRMRR